MGRMMKRMLALFALLLLLAVAAGAIFLWTFDADRYRPGVVAGMEAALGRAVELEKVSLRWHGGLAAELKNLSLHADRQRQGQPAFQAGRVIVQLRVMPLLRGEVPAAIQRIVLQEGSLRLNVSGPSAAALQGRLAGSLELAFEGTPGPELTQGVSGKGALQLRDLRLVNMNLLRDVFDRISILPGLSERLLARLPPSYQERISARDTVFRPVDLNFSLGQGILSLGELDVATDSFQLTSSGGRVGLDGRLDVPAQVRVEPDLSAALVQSVEELKYLTDEGGRVIIPLALQGTLQRISVAPDLQYLTSKLLATKAQDLLGDLLNRVIE